MQILISFYDNVVAKLVFSGESNLKTIVCNYSSEIKNTVQFTCNFIIDVLI